MKLSEKDEGDDRQSPFENDFVLTSADLALVHESKFTSGQSAYLFRKVENGYEYYGKISDKGTFTDYDMFRTNMNSKAWKKLQEENINVVNVK